MRYAFTLGGRTHHVTLAEHADGPRFVVEGATFEPAVVRHDDGNVEATIDGETFRFRIHHGRIEDDQGPMDLQIRRARPALVRAGAGARRGDGRVKPPMPGKVVEVPVEEGQTVAEGEVLVVLEAMKMQNDIKSPFSGTVSKIHVQDGQNVEATTVLIEVEPAEE